MANVSFSGMASGIDTDALIEATLDAKRSQRIKPLEDKISEAEDESSAINTLKDKLLSLKSELSKYNTLAGGAVKKEALSSDESVVSAVASNVANQGSYDITVTSLAKRGIFTVGRTFESASSIVDSSAVSGETFTIKVGTGVEQKELQVQIGATTTPADIVDYINANNIGCQASCINIGTLAEPAYTIMITSSQEGLSKGSLEVTTESGSENITNLINNGTLTQAKNAVFSIAGLASNIQRESNGVADIIPGVSLNLNAIGTSVVTISNDLDNTESNVKDIIDAINDIFSFVSENNTVERQEDGDDVQNIFAALSKTTVDNNVVQSIKAVITSTKEANGTYVRIFADFGITTNPKLGTLDFDTDKFEEAFSKDPNAINSILTKFSDTLSSTGGMIEQFTRYNGLLDVVINNNTNQITDYNDRIGRYESMLAKEESQMRAMYARFEKLMSELQNSANSLTSLI